MGSAASAAARKTPSAGNTAEIAYARAEIDSAFDVLQKVDKQIGATLDFTPDGLAKRNRQGCDYLTVRKEWAKLVADMPSLSGDAAGCETSATDLRHPHDDRPCG